MRYLVLSDIHANWEALWAVLEDAAGQYDCVVCCGDLVGYGADPNLVVEWVRAHACAVVRGNHDKAAAGLQDAEDFNPYARAAAQWTAHVLSPENALYLRRLPAGPQSLPGFDLVHGSPTDEDEYLTWVEPSLLLPYLSQSLTFFGHTHCQLAFCLRGPRAEYLSGVPAEHSRITIRLQARCRYLVNPGSVGQPRDGDPRAAYALYDDAAGEVYLCRTLYPISVAQAKILRAGLPAYLAERLASGT